MISFNATVISSQDFRSPKGNFFQTAYWASVKTFSHWKGFFFRIEGEGKDFDLMVLVKKVAGPFLLAYVPGVNTPETDSDIFLDSLSNAIKPLLPKGLLMIRYDLLTTRGTLQGKGRLRKASADIQPPDTVILPLDNEEKILSGMKTKTRYNIRLCEKKGVKIREGNFDELSLWYKLYEETSLRDRIALHPQSYYHTVFEKALSYPGITMTLYLAEHEGDLLAGIIVLRNGTQAVYLYGASSNLKRDLMPAYGLQWQAIKDSLQAGCSEYDFFGIPPDENPSHPMHGLYRFKTGFGGRLEHREGCWDWAASKFFYALYRKAESLRQWYFKVFKKR